MNHTLVIRWSVHPASADPCEADWLAPTPPRVVAPPLCGLGRRGIVLVMSSTATLERPPEAEGSPSALRGFAAVFVAGGLAGLLVGGLGSRVAMRIAALTARHVAQGLTTEAGATVGRITLEGTVFLVLFAGVGSALVGTAFYPTTRAWLPRRRWVRGLAFGGLELAVFGTTLLDPATPTSRSSAGPCSTCCCSAPCSCCTASSWSCLANPAGGS